MELQGFSDALERAYAAMVYSRMIDMTGPAQDFLIMSKTKGVPIRKVTIPQIELCGVVLHFTTKPYASFLGGLKHTLKSSICLN